MSQPADWNSKLYEAKHAFVWKAADSLLELLNAQPGERILDLGCGTGHLSERIASAGADVIGLDHSQAMLEQARASFPHLRFEQGDARDFSFDQPFDAVFSNATLHWVKPPEAAAICIVKALRPGGRFVAEFGGRGNVRTIESAIHTVASRISQPLTESLWYYPSIAEYSAVLEQAGLEVTFATLFDRPTPLSGTDGLRDWIRMFCGGVLGSLSPQQQDEFLSEVEALTRPALFRNDCWIAEYRRLRVIAVRGRDELSRTALISG